MSLLDDINNGNVPVFTDEYGRQFVWQTTGFDSGVPVYLDDLRKQIQPANSYAEQAKGLLGQWSSLIDLPQMQQYLSKIDTPEELAYMQDKFDPTKVPHVEELIYQLAGFADQKNIDAWEKQQSGQQTTALENMLIDNPSMAGQSVVRPDIPDLYQGVANPNAADGGPAYTQALYDKYGVTEADYNQAATDWATNNTAAAQAARDTDDGFGALLGIGILLAAGVATGGFGLAGVGAEAGALGAIGGTGAEALAAADLAAGIGAAEAIGGTAAAATAAAGVGAVADAAGTLGAIGGTDAIALTAADSAAGIGAAETASTVGSDLLSSIGQGAFKGAVTSAVTGGDPIKGALTGGLTGGIMSQVPAIETGLGAAANAAANAAIKGAVSGGVATAVAGGDFSDILEGAAISGIVQGAASGVQSLVKDTLAPPTGETDDQYVSVATATDTDRFDYINTVSNAAGGAAGGAIGALATGGDVGDAVLIGGLAGAGAGLATDLGAQPATAGAVGNLTGAVVANALEPEPQTQQQPPSGQTSAPTTVAGISWGDFVAPQFIDVGRRDMKWGSRFEQRGTA